MLWLKASTITVMLFVSAPAVAASAPQPDFGQPLQPANLEGKFAIPPSGAGLPAGRGTSAQGQEVYAASCVACHGDKLQGVKSIGGPALIGGRGSLTTNKPIKTVESYWPYATTVFDYVKRAMPFNAPGSLSDDQVYSVVAYILAQGQVIQTPEVLDARTLPQIHMPNAAGFEPDPRPPEPLNVRLPK